MIGTMIYKVRVGCVCSVNKDYANSSRASSTGRSCSICEASHLEEGALQFRLRFAKCAACKGVQRASQELPALRGMTREGLVFLWAEGNN